MIEWLHAAIGDSLARLEAHADEIELVNIDEFTFRAFMMASIVAQRPDAQLQAEWKKYDLLVQVDGKNHLIEFKFYVLRRTFDLDGRPGNWKGSAGSKNEGEFWKNIQKLHECKHNPIDGRHMVLCCERESTRASRYSFEKSYGAISPDEMIGQVVNFESKRLRCFWFVIR